MQSKLVEKLLDSEQSHDCQWTALSIWLSPNPLRSLQDLPVKFLRGEPLDSSDGQDEGEDEASDVELVDEKV